MSASPASNKIATTKHHLQRLASPSRQASLILHVSRVQIGKKGNLFVDLQSVVRNSLIFFKLQIVNDATAEEPLILCWSRSSLVDNPNIANESYGWHFQFLTIIGLALAWLTFVTGAIADITASRNLFLLKNGLLFCSAPLETLISVLYWGLRLVCLEGRIWPAKWLTNSR